MSSGYEPTDQDVLNARNPTVGIHENHFSLPKLNFSVIDVGGCRTQRRKWIHCFMNISSLIFCAALSDFNLVLLEDSSRNRMLESISVFESLMKSKYFTNCAIMLFLNKTDLFKKKMEILSIKDYFSEYPEIKERDPEAGMKFF